jgi:hypothetical protein
MKFPGPPLLHGLLPIARKVEFNFLLFHERRKNGLIDWIVCRVVLSVTDVIPIREEKKA